MLELNKNYFYEGNHYIYVFQVIRYSEKNETYDVNVKLHLTNNEYRVNHLWPRVSIENVHMTECQDFDSIHESKRIDIVKKLFTFKLSYDI